MVGSLTTQVKRHTNNDDFDLMTRLIIRLKKIREGIRLFNIRRY